MDENQMISFLAERANKIINYATASAVRERCFPCIISKMRTMKYIPDTRDVLKPPEKTLRDGGGDCEDLACLAYAYLLSAGLRPQIIAFYSTDNPIAHVAVIVEHDGKRYLFSNNEVTTINSIEKTAKAMNYNRAIIFNYPEELIANA
ncbi:MAG: transglutaminase-like domain-containing protein [Candidatus Thorarchaeota archaeon]